MHYDPYDARGRGTHLGLDRLNDFSRQKNSSPDVIRFWERFGGFLFGLYVVYKVLVWCGMIS